MYCKNCGMRIEDDASFCPSCGARVEKPAEPSWGPDTRRTMDAGDPDAWKGKMTIPLIATLVVSMIFGLWGAVIVLILLLVYYAVLKTPRDDAEVKGTIFGGIIGLVLGYVINLLLVSIMFAALV